MEASITLRRNNKGITLAEMIVTFALIGIFMASAAAVISSAILMHSEITGVMYAQNVGEMILDKVAGELAAAKNPGSGSIVIREGKALESAAVDQVSYQDRDGRTAQIGVEDGLLYIHYQQRVAIQDDGEVVTQPEQDFRMDEKAYMGYRITDFQVERLNAENVYEIRVRLQNLKTGFEYSTTRCTQCYNYYN